MASHTVTAIPHELEGDSDRRSSPPIGKATIIYSLQPTSLFTAFPEVSEDSTLYE